VLGSQVADKAEARALALFEPLPPACPADLNGDGTVGGADIAMLLGAWGGLDASADLNADGVVSAPDLAIMLSSWGACGG